MRTEEFNHIILPMRSDLKAYALRLTESDDNAEDLVQEVMLRLWDIRQNIKAEDNLPMLYRSDSARIQTLNLLIRSQVLYSVELRNHSFKLSSSLYSLRDSNPRPTD